jgi:hypothetical protein
VGDVDVFFVLFVHVHAVLAAGVRLRVSQELLRLVQVFSYRLNLCLQRVPQD